MTVERTSGNIEELLARRDNLSGIIRKREGLYGRIGEGDIRPENSLDNALRVGIVREKVSQSKQAYQEKLGIINEQILEIQAEEYIEERGDLNVKLTELKRLKDGGHISGDIYEKYNAEYTAFENNRLNETLGLREVVERMDKEMKKESETLINSRRKLLLLIEEQPEPRGKGQVSDWTESWDKSVKDNGDDSLYKLFPRVIERDASYFTRVLNSIVRHEGIVTKSNLLDFTDEELLGIRGIGDRGLETLNIMKEIILAERENNQPQK